MDITTILTLMGSLGVLEFVKWLFGRRTQRQADEVSIVAQHVEINKHLLDRISANNKALDSKTDRIRSLTDRLYETERTVNHVNDELKREKERCADLMLKVQHYRQWHCRNGDCPDRMPPNPTLQGAEYHDPAPATEQ